jgi:hypothetical protein
MAIIRPIPAGAYLGKGVDAELGITYGEALDFAPAIPVVDNSQGQKVEFHLRQITNTAELHESLNVSASASVGIGLFGASAEFKYVAQQQVNQYSTYLLASVIVKNPDRIIRSPRFKPDVYKLLAERGWDDFEARYGPDYMAGVVTGGSYYGLIEIKNTNQQEQKEIAVAVSAGYGLFKASAELDRRLKNAIENKELRVTIFQSGGSGDPVETTLEEMIQQAKTFPQLVRDHPVEFQGIFEDYRRTVPLPTAVGEGQLSRAHRLAVMEELGLQYWKYKDLRANLIYVLEQFYEFEDHLELNPEEQAAKKANYQTDLEQVTQHMNDLEKRARGCRENYSACELPGQYFTPSEPLPEINGENLMLKQMQEDMAKLKMQLLEQETQVNQLQAGLVVDGQGKVGVGSKDPRSHLHLYSSGKTAQLRLQAGHGFGSGQIEFWSNPQGEANEWRPASIASTDNGNFSGGLAFNVNGVGHGQRVQSKEVMRLVNGKVGIGTPNPVGTLDVHGDVTVNGEKPFHYRYYVGDRVNTGYPVSDWVATIAGYRALNGDIQEHNTGPMIQVYTYVHEDQWWYHADFRSHRQEEQWHVWILFIHRALALL